jgi:SPP1 family predicted phage head-tail adaptor
MNIQPGMRSHRIQLQRRSGLRDALGQPSQTFTTYGKVWARVRSLQGRELYLAQQFSPETTHEVMLAWEKGLTDGISPLDRILLEDGKTMLDIQYCNYGETRLDDVVLLCKERLGSTAA